MILGTAGHVDHGKTSLVKALTGTDTDRLPEEKKRGMTLELGFARLPLSDGSSLGVIDVPGHEKFVKAMAAGAGGVDLALLVIALDEGVMPQTREHIDICTLLSVRSGLVVLTKSDLLPTLGPEWDSMVRSDVKAAVQGTVFEDAPVIAVSSRTSDGIAGLKTEIEKAVKQLSVPKSDGPLFVPIDRAFSIKGFGCVVTGTIRSGTLRSTDEVSVVPGVGGQIRLRGLQIHGQPADSAGVGTRVAINLSGIEPESIERGRVLTRAGELPEVTALDVRLELLPSVEKSLARRTRQLVVLGTQHVECVVSLVGVDSLRPGETCFAQLRFGQPVAALPQQRFVLRGTTAQPGRGATMGGGAVLTLNPPRRRKSAAEALKTFEEAALPQKAQWLIDEAGYPGLLESALFTRLNVSEKEVVKTVDGLLTRGLSILVEKEPRRLISKQVFTAMGNRARARLEAFHVVSPEQAGMSREELKQRLGIANEKTFHKMLSGLLEDGHIEASGEVVHLPGRGRVFDVQTAALQSQLVSLLENAALGPPTRSELELKLKIDGARLDKVLALLITAGAVVRVGELFFAATALIALTVKMEQHFATHRELTTQQFKEMTGQSRKFTIPLAEHFDAIKLTLRVGEARVLRQAKS